MRGVADNSGKMYLFSGGNVVNGHVASNINEMLILDTKNLIWTKGSVIGAPLPRQNYGAVLLPNNDIIYIGRQVSYCM